MNWPEVLQFGLSFAVTLPNGAAGQQSRQALIQTL
jgi:hypothetical protein